MLKKKKLAGPTCKKKLAVETGNEAENSQHCRQQCRRRAILKGFLELLSKKATMMSVPGVHVYKSEGVRHVQMYVMHLACTINCILLAITHAYKYSWLLKPRYFAGGSEGLSRLKGLLFEDEYRGAEDRAKLQGYIGEPLARSTVDALNEGRKYCLPIYNSH